MVPQTGINCAAYFSVFKNQICGGIIWFHSEVTVVAASTRNITRLPPYAHVSVASVKIDWCVAFGVFGVSLCLTVSFNSGRKRKKENSPCFIKKNLRSGNGNPPHPSSTCIPAKGGTVVELPC